MNAGYIPMDHWVHGDEGGGRNLGEACHIYDLFILSNSKLERYLHMRYNLLMHITRKMIIS